MVMEWRVCVVLHTGFHCSFYLLKPEAGSSEEASISSVILLNDESLMEAFVVLLVDQLQRDRPPPVCVLDKDLFVVLELCCCPEQKL